jgi:hypothetical protein
MIDFIPVFCYFCVKEEIMDVQIRKAIEDMEVVAASGKYSLEAQVRAYDLLERLYDHYGDIPSSVGEYRSAYSRLAGQLKSAWNG